VVRVYAESASLDRVEELIKAGEHIVATAAG
jgi:hypothetical protein